MKLIGYKRKNNGKRISLAMYDFISFDDKNEYEPIYQDIQTSDSSVPVAENVVAGDGMKSEQEIIDSIVDAIVIKLGLDEYGAEEIQFIVESKFKTK